VFSPVVIIVVALAGLIGLGLAKAEFEGRRFPMALLWAVALMVAVVAVMSSCGYLDVD
jgi:hypothetical protein